MMRELTGYGDLAYYISAAYIPGIVSTYGNLSLLDRYVNMTLLELQGEVIDLIGTIPELEITYTK